MNIKDVKLPLKTNLKILFKVLADESQESFDIMATIVSICFGAFMAFSTPLFLTNIVANIILFIFLTVFYIACLLAAFILLIKFFDEDFKPACNHFMNKFDDVALPYRQKIVEEVDNILLKKKKDNENKKR